MAIDLVTLGGIHPDFVARLYALRGACEARGWGMGWTSAARSFELQLRMWQDYKAGRRRASAANPYSAGRQSPWGWYQRGSFHMVQQDGYAHAVDINISGVAWAAVHDLAFDYGVRFPLMHLRVPEPWHAQWWNGPELYPAPRMESPIVDTGDEPMKWTLVTPQPGPSARYPNGHPLSGAWYNVNELGMGYHCMTGEQIQLAIYFGAQHDNGGPVQISHDWFDTFCRMTGDAAQGALQTRA